MTMVKRNGGAHRCKRCCVDYGPSSIQIAEDQEASRIRLICKRVSMTLMDHRLLRFKCYAIALSIRARYLNSLRENIACSDNVR